jgi:hypothetical protein
MSRTRRAILVLTLLLALGAGRAPAEAAGPQAVGNGVLRTTAAGAAFVVQLDEAHLPSFTYWDYTGAPPRVISMAEPPTAVDCLGELFGGQTIGVTAAASDSATPGEAVTLRLFLVDGGPAGPHRLSLKVSRTNGAVAYFAPLRDLESGVLSVSCPS